MKTTFYKNGDIGIQRIESEQPFILDREQQEQLVHQLIYQTPAILKGVRINRGNFPKTFQTCPLCGGFIFPNVPKTSSGGE